MLSPIEISIIIVLIIIASWWWHTHGQHDYALKQIKGHCKKLDLTLLDGYVALKKISIKKDSYGKIRLAKIYSFEFTVTGEQRYTGYITLFGYHVGNIELPPYPFTRDNLQNQDNDILESKPNTPILTLDHYRKIKRKHDENMP